MPKAPAGLMRHATLPLGVERIRKRRDFLAANKKGRRKPMPHLVMIAVRRNQQIGESQPPRAGFTATKRIGNAVQRNRARRRLKALARDFLPQLGQAGFDYVFIARRDTAFCPAPALKGQFLAALKQAARTQ